MYPSPAWRGRGSHRRQVLRGETWLAPVRTNTAHRQRPAGDGGEAERGAKDLATAFAV